MVAELTVMVGIGTTTTVNVFEPIHPCAFVPVTVYTVVVVGKKIFVAELQELEHGAHV